MNISANIRNIIMNSVSETKYTSKLYLIKKCLRKGYKRNDILFGISDITINRKSFNTSTSKKRLLVDKGGTFLKKYNELIDGKTIIEDPSIEKLVWTPKQNLFKKYLIILPCTPTAEQGNYFYSKLWQIISLYFPERYTKDVDFAAIDCITLKLDNKDRGCIVFENEMDRVKGYNINPTFSPFSDEEKEKLVNYLEKDLLYIFNILKYEHIIVYLNVSRYINAFKSVLQKLPEKYKNKITFYNLDAGSGPFNKTIRDLRKKYKEVRYKIINNIPTNYEEYYIENTPWRNYLKDLKLKRDKLCQI
jgi:hypothetical protein